MSVATTDIPYGVLYVDDEEQALKYFRKGFEKKFRVFTASSVEQAMSILTAEQPTIGVVMSDQRMPQGSGVELLSELRRKWPSIVRILITAHTDIDDAVAAVNAGAIYKYVNKPADFVLLEKILQESLELHRQTVERDALAETLRQLKEQRRATEQAEAEREALQQRLINASRDAGRAEVATGVLHNIGNVLNSMNVSTSVITKLLGDSKVGNLVKGLKMLEEHSASLTRFLEDDDRGKMLPGYLIKLSSILSDEQKMLINEVEALRGSLEHIGGVVQMQQAYAKAAAVPELVPPASLLEDAIRMNRSGLERSGAQIHHEHADLPAVLLDKHRVLQILINLIGNAANALGECPQTERRITTRIALTGNDGQSLLRIEVADNGMGIPAENLTRIFTHGFTTRRDGHGFGLHSSANAAREMGGSLNVRSEGAGKGATFCLELPVNCPLADTEVDTLSGSVS